MTQPRTVATSVVLALPLAFAVCRHDPADAISASLVADESQFSEWSAPANLGAPVNSAFGDAGSFESRDGLTLYISSTREPGCGGFDIWVASRARVDEPWGEPVNLGCDVNSSGLDAAPVLTIDGHRLYFHSDRPGGAGAIDLYITRRRDQRDPLGWGPPENLASVNTAGTEVQPAIFEEDETHVTTLFFVSGRPGGLGGGDIYAATEQPDGSFGPALLVTELSSSAQDQGPAIRRDGLEMFVTSNRPGTAGGLDIWVSKRATTSDVWSAPVNLGADFNSTVLDDRATFSFDGRTMYFQSGRTGGLGANDIYVSTREKLKE